MTEKRMIDKTFNMIALVWELCNLKVLIILRLYNGLFVNLKFQLFPVETTPE